MALKVWLPLNGNLKNIGTDGGELTTSQTNIWNDNGKIGKCLLGNAQASATFPSLINTTNFSIAYWLYIDSSLAIQNWYDIWNVFCTIGSTSANIRDEFKNAAGVHQVLIGKDTTVGGNTNNYYGLGVSDSNAKDKWVHITIVKSNSDVKTFIDGVLSNTIINSNFENSPQKLTGKITLGNMTTSTAARINDFRVYDHCLSKLEVKEVAQGLILHYRLDGFNSGVGENLLLGSRMDYTPISTGTNYTADPIRYYNTSSSNCIVGNGQATILLNSTSNLGIAFERLAEEIDLDTSSYYTLSCEAKCTQENAYLATGLSYYKTTDAAVWRGGTNKKAFTSITDWQKFSLTFKPDADTKAICYCFTVNGLSNGTEHFYLRHCKLEKGSVATKWTPSIEEFGKDEIKIVDSSGYDNNGFLVDGTNEIIEVDNGRYQVCTNLLGTTVDLTSNTITGAQYLYAPFKMPAWTAITVAWWGNNISYGRGGIFETTGTTGNIWEGSDYNTTAIANWDSNFGIYNGSARINIFNNFVKDSTWHHHAITFDGTNVKYYCDSILKQTSALTGTLPAITGFKMGLGRAGGVYRQIKQKLNDLRIYTTALSADDIFALYKTSAQIDKSKAFHTFAISENSDKAIRKNGITEIQNISEFDALSYLKYDPNLHIEPDGSVWVHIYHHNHPDLGSFASTDTFAASVKKDENRWFNGTQVCNQLNKWEFLIKYAFTEGGIEYKERWIQTKNPENAVFGDVDAADITRITGDGYKTGTWGGLYKKNSNAYWIMNDGSSGHWYGATGSFSIYQGGIPGYGGTVTTTGYNDLYVRIDNVLSVVSTNGRITKNGILIGSNFIEK